MTNDEWASIALLLHRGFKWSEAFGAAHDRAYRILLDGYEAEQIAAALNALVARGQVFGPTAGEIVGEIRRDPDAPTFAERTRRSSAGTVYCGHGPRCRRGGGSKASATD